MEGAWFLRKDMLECWKQEQKKKKSTQWRIKCLLNSFLCCLWFCLSCRTGLIPPAEVYEQQKSWIFCSLCHENCHLEQKWNLFALSDWRGLVKVSQSSHPGGIFAYKDLHMLLAPEAWDRRWWQCHCHLCSPGVGELVKNHWLPSNCLKIQEFLLYSSPEVFNLGRKQL